MKAFISKLGPVVALTLLSQALSLAVTLALPLLGANAADTASIGSQIGLTSFTGVVVGIVYNIALGRPGFPYWQRWAVIAGALSFVFAGVQAVSLVQTGFVARVGADLAIGTLGLFSAGGAAIAVSGVIATRLACEGSPRLFAGITVLPNLGMLGGILVAWWLAASPLVVAVGWMLGSIVLLVLAATLGRATHSRPSQVDTRSLAIHTLGLAVGMISSSVMPILYLAAVSQLAAGTVYIVTLFARVGNAAVTLSVNSLLLVSYNWNSRERRSQLPSTLLGGAFSALVLVSIGCAVVLGQPMVGAVIAGIAWLLSVVAGALTTRAINADARSRTVLAKAMVELPLLAGAAAVLFATPSIVGYFAAFSISQALSMLVGGIALRRRSLLAVGAAALICAWFLLFVGWPVR